METLLRGKGYDLGHHNNSSPANSLPQDMEAAVYIVKPLVYTGEPKGCSTVNSVAIVHQQSFTLITNHLLMAIQGMQ